MRNFGYLILAIGAMLFLDGGVVLFSSWIDPFAGTFANDSVQCGPRVAAAPQTLGCGI